MPPSLPARRAWVALAALLASTALLSLTVGGCAELSGVLGSGDFGWFDGEEPRPLGGQRTQLRWTRRITPELDGIWGEGAYTPVERAAAALDPGRDRVYVGSSSGRLWSLTSAGERLYTYDAQGPIGSRPALDARRGVLFVGTENGVLHALRAQTGELLWRADVGGAIGQDPILTEDAVYVVTDDDIVAAVERENGEILWRYRRQAPEGYYVTEHAGITIANGKLLTAFTEGVVTALSAADGRVLWERDTAIDVPANADGTPRFVDVDTTPVVIDETVYVASFAGGVYALELNSGTVRWTRSELTGVTAISQAPGGLLVLSSAEHGVICVEQRDGSVRWRRRLIGGAPSRPVIAEDVILVGESRGGFLTLAFEDGHEIGRIQGAHGFSASASVTAGRGFVISNGGDLFAFQVSR